MALHGECVKGYLEKYPNMPALTMAKKIYAENVELFKSVDHARSVVRYYIGQSGSNKKSRIAETTFFREAGDKSPFERIPDGITYLSDWSAVRIKSKKTLVIADLHAPYHDKTALTIALESGYKEGCDCILLLGDAMDFFSVSFWEKDPRKRDFQFELDVSRTILKTISEEFSGARLIYKIGNHEERYERYLQVKAPELLGVDYFEFSKITHCDKLGFDVVGDKKIVKIGTLNLVHAHEFGRYVFSPVNPARGLFLRAKAHCLGAHHHQSSYHPETNMNGKVIGCWSIGCLCDMHPQYLPINKWNHGFAIVDYLGGDEFLVNNKTIIKGKVY